MAAIRIGESFGAGITELVVSIIAEVSSIGFKIAIPNPPLVDVTLGSWCRVNLLDFASKVAITRYHTFLRSFFSEEIVVTCEPSPISTDKHPLSSTKRPKPFLSCSLNLVRIPCLPLSGVVGKM